MDLPTSYLRANGFPRIGNLDDTRSPSLLVIGDSHGDALLPVVEELCINFRIPAIAANRRATLPLPGVYRGAKDIDKARFHQLVLDYIDTTSSLHYVFLVGRWNAYDDVLLNAEAFLGFHDALRRQGIQLWCFRQIPAPTIAVPRALALNEYLSRSNMHPGANYRQFVERRARTDALFAQLEAHGAEVIDPLEWFFPDECWSRVAIDGRALFVDDDHISVFGAMQLRPMLEPLFSRISESEQTRQHE